MDKNIKFLEVRIKEIVIRSENEQRETKEYHLARDREEQLKFERHQLKQKAEFSKTQNSTPDLLHKQSVNCTGPHRATNCRSRGNCANCKQSHHTSICDRNGQLSNEAAAMAAAHVGEKVYHPVVVVKVNSPVALD